MPLVRRKKPGLTERLASAERFNRNEAFSTNVCRFQSDFTMMNQIKMLRLVTFFSQPGPFGRLGKPSSDSTLLIDVVNVEFNVKGGSTISLANDQYWSSESEKVIHILGAAKCEQAGDGTSSKEWI
jgi:hypothetical protein